MRPNEHNLNSLRGIVRKLQNENKFLKKLLDENGITYDSITDIIDTPDILDEYASSSRPSSTPSA